MCYLRLGYVACCNQWRYNHCICLYLRYAPFVDQAESHLSTETLAGLLLIFPDVGFFSGAIISIIFPAVAQLSPAEDLGAYMGAFSTVLSVGTLIGTPVGGAFLNNDSSKDAYKHLIIFGVGSSAYIEHLSLLIHGLIAFLGLYHVRRGCSYLCCENEMQSQFASKILILLRRVKIILLRGVNVVMV